MADKRQVAAALREISAYLGIAEGNRFKTAAFERAARQIEGLTVPLGDLVSSGQIYDTPGIGKAIGPIVTELATTGTSTYLEELRAAHPPGILELIRVPGMTPRRVAAVHESLQITTIDELETAARENRLAPLKGFGKKAEQKVLEGVAFLRRHEARVILPKGIEIATQLSAMLMKLDGVEEVIPTGEIRRKLETVSRIELCVVAARPQHLAAMLRRQGLGDGEERESSSAVVRGRFHDSAVAIHLCSRDELPRFLVETTGSEEFAAFVRAAATSRGLDLMKAEADNEKELLRRIGVSWVEPERREPEHRETWGRRQEKLVEPKQVRGTFHVHSTWSDGRNTLAEMLDAARERRLLYVGISDHSKTASYAGGLTENRVTEQAREIASLRPSYPDLTIFHGTEADILVDGSIDYDEATLSRLDFVIASVHSKFGMPRDEMTERIVTALGNPFVTILGHLTGRLLLSREGYTVDYDRVFAAAAENGVLIEINGNPLRLDLDWRRIGKAREMGVRFAINPDAHSTDSLSNIVNATWAARKGGLPSEAILNTAGPAEVAEYLRKRKERALSIARSSRV